MWRRGREKAEGLADGHDDDREDPRPRSGARKRAPGRPGPGQGGLRHGPRPHHPARRQDHARADGGGQDLGPRSRRRHSGPLPTRQGLGRLTREFSRDMGVKWYFEVGQGGICHTVLPENGLVLPGELVVGADSHSCTYGALNNFATGIGSTDLACVLALGELWFRVPESLKFVYHNRLKEWVEAKDLILYVIGQIGVDGARSKAMEHVGEALKHIDMEARLTMTNMAIEAGAKNGIMEFDEVTREYLDGRAKRPYTPVSSDPDAEYEKVFEFDAAKVELGVAKPMSPDNYAPLSEVAGTKLDQVFIGSCTNSRITDLRRAAAVLDGHKVAPGVRLIITPSSHQVAIQAEREGLIGIFLASGAAWTTATCGACLGGKIPIRPSFSAWI